MDPRRVRYFLAVVEEMHFGRAAERLRMTQPALSQQIRRLEQELDVALFDRSRRRVELTDAGQALALDGRHLLDHHDKVREAARGAGRGEVGTLRVGMVGTAVIGLLPEPLFDEPLVAVLPAGHRLAGHQLLPADALREEPFVLWPRWRSPVLYDRLFSPSGSLGFAPRVAQEVNGVQTNLALVAAGVGVSLLPASVRVLAHTGVVFRPWPSPPRGARSPPRGTGTTTRRCSARSCRSCARSSTATGTPGRRLARTGNAARAPVSELGRGRRAGGAGRGSGAGEPDPTEHHRLPGPALQGVARRSSSTTRENPSPP